MKKTILMALSYVLVAVMATVATLAMVTWIGMPVTPRGEKLQQLESLILSYFIGEKDETKIEDAAAAGMISSLGDRWSYYIPADQYALHEQQKNNAYVGIGVTVSQLADGSAMLIEKVTVGGPSEKAGILAEDLVIAVDDQSIAGMDLNSITAIIQGEENTQVKLTIRRGTEVLNIVVTRQRIQTPVAIGTMLDDQIGLIKIVNFNTNCSKEMIAAVDTLLEQGAEKLIFDVRFNPGGFVSETVATLDYLLPECEVFRSVDYAGRETIETSDAACIDVPMAVLVNADSYSGAEFFAAALSEYEKAIVVGEKTSGKGYFQSTFRLEDGSAVGLSIGKYFTPKGKSLEGIGITPDVPVEVDDQTAYDIYQERLDPSEDPQIQAAVKALLGK